MARPGCPQPCLRHSNLALLLLATALATGLPCHHLPTHDPGNALQLLQNMASSTTEPCHLRDAPFFPDILRRNNLHPQQAATAALRILQGLFHTLSDNSTRHHWHSQPHNDLLNQLQHHIHHLEPCLRNSTTLFKRPRNTLLTIKKYFRDIHLFLQAHNHSACAWDHVRMEALECFKHVDRLIRQMK
ncbi:IFNB protein, partial [Malurus elegans]|nr:IFNB protein [Malurus elegans]